MLTQQVRKTKSDGMTSVSNREEGQNNKVPTLCKWKHTMHIYGSMEGTLLTAVIEAQEG